MNNQIIILSSATACLLLSACKADFSVDLYASDAFTDINIATPATMKVEIASCTSDSRPEQESNILALFSNSSQAKIIGCANEGMNSMVEVAFMAELASQESNADVILFREALNVFEANGITYEPMAIKPVISSSFLTRVNELMDKNFQTLTYDDISVEIYINNDERSDILVTAYDVWVDGQPYQSFYRQPLTRREKITIELPDVMNDLILQEQYPVAFYLSRATE